MAEQQQQFCVDAISPVRLRDIGQVEAQLNALSRAAPVPPDVARAIALSRSVWENGRRLRVNFINASQAQRDKVTQVARRWMDHANLQLDFGDHAQSEIRVAFVQDGRSWSYVGTDNLNIPGHAATMNFGWALEDGTILHEFGHAIGLSHEHQNPQGGISWNEANVIRDLSGPPNNWDEATIRHNVLNKYRQDQLRGTDFDKQSIMLYAFPASWTTTNVATARNDTLSETDKSFVGGANMYPKTGGGGGGGDDAAVELKVAEDTGADADIGRAGEEDLFKFTAAADGNYTIETQGPTDVLMRLFGPDSRTTLIAEDDDSGEATNARIVRTLAPGEYFVQVRHFNPQSATGTYRIKVSR